MDHFDAQPRRLRSLFGVFFAPEVTGALLPLARPALRLTAGGAGAVRLGGAPLLPPGEPWPSWQGRPLDHLGSVDFGLVPEVPGLPRKGTAAFYYAAGPPRLWGDAAAHRGAWRVFHGDLQKTDREPGPEVLLDAETFLSLPSPQEPLLRRVEERFGGTLPVYEQLHAAWRQHVWPDATPVHQLGGWPALIQRPVGPDCHRASSGLPPDAPLTPEESRSAGEEWRLLLQLDSDDRLEWHWGDPGRLFFCTREEAPLEDAWMTLQAT
ncbi:DUF1963 domain-containing protein [Actinomadura sp. 21ATH]|uniref:DUF1963 domain-containing protein n=1 Tax=Actinomadura sp. 21ATH TaxID=1735444 RepID=UPI0035C10FC4